MLIGGIQKMTLIDYPAKVAAIVFTIGCNFRCRFCYNTRLVEPKLFDQNEIISEKTIFDFLKTRIGKLDAVVITGGEPTLQKDLVGFIKKIKEMGFLVKLDTNGTDPQTLKKLLEEKLLDYVAMDIKNELTMEAYKIIVQSEIDIELIKQSIAILRDSNIDYEFRTTVAPGITKDNILNIVEYIKGANKYYLQEFQDMEVIDNSCKQEGWLKESDLNLIVKEIGSMIKECKVR